MNVVVCEWRQPCRSNAVSHVVEFVEDDDAQQHPPHQGLERRGVGMLLIADILIAVIFAIGVGPDSRVREPTLPRPTEQCQPALTIGHVQGRLDKLWIIGCEPP